MSIVLINLDNTLLAEPNAEKLFYGFMRRRHMVRRRHRRQRFWFNLRWLMRFGKAVRAHNKAWFGGMRRADVDVFAEGFAKRKLKELIYEEMLDRIDAHREAGDTVVLFSETPECIVEQLARMLKIKTFRGTVCAYLGNLYLNTPPFTLLEGRAKIKTAQRLCQDFGTDMKDCIAYMHSENDIPLMLAVGQSVVVNPSRSLRKIADEQDWEVMDIE